MLATRGRQCSISIQVSEEERERKRKRSALRRKTRRTKRRKGRTNLEGNRICVLVQEQRTGDKEVLKEEEEEEVRLV